MAPRRVGAGRRTRPAPHSGGTAHPARCGGRTAGTPRTAVAQGSASHMPDTHRLSRAEAAGPVVVAVAWGGVDARPPAGTRANRSADVRPGRRPARRSDKLSLRHRYATAVQPWVPPAARAGRADGVTVPTSGSFSSHSVSKVRIADARQARTRRWSVCSSLSAYFHG